MPQSLTKHTEERLKLLANGLQNIAIAMFVGVLLTPLINPAFVVTWGQTIAATAVMSVLELLALYLLGLRPASKDP